jgi:threonine dehydrogenase-like Zn-dependent dehydrogenase
MKAIVFDGVKTSLKEIPKPNIDAKFNTLIKVVYAGICKTDVYMSEGKMSGKSPVVLGHEFSGYVVETLDKNLKSGDFVACNPILSDQTMLGVDYDGAFAEYIKVPAPQCYVFNGDSQKMAAYIEPLAASMAPMKNQSLLKNKKIGIVGKDRIGKLTETIFKNHQLDASFVTDMENDTFDVIVETWAEEQILDNCIDALKEGGLLILKSRNYKKVPLDLYKIVKKGIRLEGMYYLDDYEKVIKFSQQCPDLNVFLGESWSLENWKEAFEKSHDSYQKIFLQVS